jgi:uncharacterized membrane protein
MQAVRLIALLCFLIPSITFGEEAILHQEIETTYRAKVLKVISTTKEDVANTGISQQFQSLEVEITNKDKKGERVTIDNSVFNSAEGDSVYVRYLKTFEGDEYYSVLEPDRLKVLFALFALFVASAIIFTGKHGIFALLSLALSFGGVFTLLFPQLLAGSNPVVVSLIIAMATLFVVMFISHGFNRVTFSAYFGCLLTVFITVILAKYAVLFAQLSGFSDEASVYLNLSTGGTLSFQGLLIAAIIIGVIGVVDDVSITQASVVAELMHSNNTLSRKELFKRAMKVGKNHSAALINTLVLAYAGASLPLLLLLYTSETPFLELINREMIATEVIRTLIGSIGLVILVPCATFISVFVLRKEDSKHSSHTHHH